MTTIAACFHGHICSVHNDAYTFELKSLQSGAASVTPFLSPISTRKLKRMVLYPFPRRLSFYKRNRSTSRGPLSFAEPILRSPNRASNPNAHTPLPSTPPRYLPKTVALPSTNNFLAAKPRHLRERQSLLIDDNDGLTIRNGVWVVGRGKGWISDAAELLLRSAMSMGATYETAECGHGDVKESVRKGRR